MVSQTPLLNLLSKINLAEPEPASVILPDKKLRALCGIYQSEGDRYSFTVEERGPSPQPIRIE